LYRRTRAEMPAIKPEIDGALEEGVRIEFLAAPVEILSKNGTAVGARCIRMELGARHQELAGMFVQQGLLLTGIGVCCGLVAAGIVMRLMSSLLFGVKALDPLTYDAVSFGLVATAALASYLPSRRAATVDPVEALRAE